jgi:hypothetical protein
MAVALKTSSISTKSKRIVPDFLVKEEIEGIRFYYHGYKAVLNRKKKIEDIMGSSAIQSLIIQYLMKILFKSDIDKRYYIFTNEIGNHIAHRNNLSHDIALYDRNLLTPDKITDKYIDGIAPSVVVEIDTDISLDDTGFTQLHEYYFTKTQKLQDFGTQKVIWIFTKNKKILVAENEVWQMYNLDATIQIIDTVSFNLAAFLADEKISL